MDYNDFETAAFWALGLGAALVSVATGVQLQVRRGADTVDRAMYRYLLWGVVGSVTYGLFAGMLLGALVPPPYVPGLSEGRGLDLRGLALVLGSWLGGLLGVLATVLTALVCWIVRRQRHPARSAHGMKH